MILQSAIAAGATAQAQGWAEVLPPLLQRVAGVTALQPESAARDVAVAAGGGALQPESATRAVVSGAPAQGWVVVLPPPSSA